jgi:hypothetical protein
MSTVQIPWNQTTPDKLSYARLDGVMKSQRHATRSYLAAGVVFASGMVAMLTQLL